MASYVVPSYKDWAAEMVNQPQQYGTDGVVSRRKPVATAVDLNLQYNVLGNRMVEMAGVRDGLVNEIVEQTKEIATTSAQIAEVLNQRNAIEAELLRRRALETILPIIPEAKSFIQVGLSPRQNRIVHRHRPWYLRPFAPMERALRKRRLDRQLMKKIEIPTFFQNYGSFEEIREFNDAEHMRVQDVFDKVTPSELKQLLKDPHYLNYYRGENIPEFYGD